MDFKTIQLRIDVLALKSDVQTFKMRYLSDLTTNSQRHSEKSFFELSVARNFLLWNLRNLAILQENFSKPKIKNGTFRKLSISTLTKVFLDIFNNHSKATGKEYKRQKKPGEKLLQMFQDISFLLLSSALQRVTLKWVATHVLFSKNEFTFFPAFSAATDLTLQTRSVGFKEACEQHIVNSIL